MSTPEQELRRQLARVALDVAIAAFDAARPQLERWWDLSKNEKASALGDSIRTQFTALRISVSMSSGGGSSVAPAVLAHTWQPHGAQVDQCAICKLFRSKKVHAEGRKRSIGPSEYTYWFDASKIREFEIEPGCIAKR